MRTVREPPPRPAPLKRIHNPPLRRERRQVPVPTQVPAVQVEGSAGEDSARLVAPISCLPVFCPPISCPPVRSPTQAPPRSAGTRYSNRAHSFPAMNASVGAGPPAEVPAAAPVVETRLAVSPQPLKGHLISRNLRYH